MSIPRPAGHTFRVGRTRVDEGWQLVATCQCKTSVTATSYPDLHGLINDHYAEIRLQRATEAEERAHT